MFTADWSNPCILLDCRSPVVQRREQGFPNPERFSSARGKTPFLKLPAKAPESAIRRQLSGDNWRRETIVAESGYPGVYYLLWLV